MTKKLVMLISVLILILAGWMTSALSQQKNPTIASSGAVDGGGNYLSKTVPPLDVIVKNLSSEYRITFVGLYKVSESQYIVYFDRAVGGASQGQHSLRRLENDLWIFSDDDWFKVLRQ